MLKEGVRAVIKKDSYPVPPIFHLLAKKGQIEEKMMYNTYNMGLGMILAVKPEDVERAMEAIKAAGEAPYVVGSIEKGRKTWYYAEGRSAGFRRGDQSSGHFGRHR